MVDPFQLTFDITATTVSLVLPAGLWAILFLLAWEHPLFAESIGFGRWAFWLLLPGAILASFALLPLAPVSDDWVAVSFAGALFPLLIGALAFGKVAPPLRRSLSRFLGVLVLESATLFFLVLPVSNPIIALLAAGGLSNGEALDLWIVLASLVWVVVALVLFARGRDARGEPGPESSRSVAFGLGLTTAVLASTFVASAAIPGVGIVEQFPEFLLPPIGAGLAAAALAPRVFPGREEFALPTAYFATTWGVLLGADLLRQPPLYGTGPAGLYTIGGAGVLDLVYLSGLLALAAALAGHRLAGRTLDLAETKTVPPGPTPIGWLGRSFRSGVRGDLSETIVSADRAGQEAAGQARRLLDVPEPPADRPWQGLPVPGWVVADQANLDALAREGTTDPREGFRAWLTARWLVNLGRDLGLRRFATVGARATAFLIDLAIAVAPAIAVWSALVVTTPGDVDTLLSNVGFTASIYGFVAFAFLYLAIAETVTGASLGKRACGLAVRDRQMRTPAFSAALVRNVSLLPMLTITALGAALSVVFVLRASSFGTLVVDGFALPAGLLAFVTLLAFLVGGIGLLGALGALVIALSSERQRIGDVWAGTWVVRARWEASPPMPAAVGAPVSPASPPGPPPTS
ncbi:MAG TPA: RDD family protein [Thermoplasmata archaeon]|nr:RDD family protein [Thermoplasmata archaeon]